MLCQFATEITPYSGYFCTFFTAHCSSFYLAIRYFICSNTFACRVENNDTPSTNCDGNAPRIAESLNWNANQMCLPFNINCGRFENRVDRRPLPDMAVISRFYDWYMYMYIYTQWLYSIKFIDTMREVG